MANRVEAARQRCGYSVLAHKTHPPIIKQEPKQMPDLIDDGTWREAALARMSEAFPTNRGLWPMYRLMAGAHRYAIDYIEQAPVIVLAAAHGNATSHGASAPLSKSSSARCARARPSCAT